MTDPTGAPENAWQLGETLLSEAESLDRFVAHRDLNSPTTLKKIAGRLGELMTAYGDSDVYATSPLLLVPTDNGVGVGMGDVAGKLVYLEYGDYPTVTETLEQGPSKLGLIALVGEVHGMNNGIEGQDLPEWRTMLLEAPLRAKYDRPGYVIGLPVVPGIKIAKMSSAEKTPDTAVELLERSQTMLNEYDHRDYVSRVEAIAHGRYIATAADRTWAEAIAKEIHNMVHECPYLGKEVEFESDWIRIPHPDSPERMIKLRGKLDGVLRKFVYAAYEDEHGRPRGGVQAVLYPREIYHMVTAGVLTPQQADKTAAIYVVLNKPHSLTVLE